MEDLSIIIPVYNELHSTISRTVEELKSLGAEVIVVDDGSEDPYPEAIKHHHNQGYGAALMTGIRAATRPLCLTIDGDGQHKVSEAVKLYHAYRLMGSVDMVIGARRLEKESLIRFLGRKMLNWFASIFCLYWLNDLNSGARIFKRDIALGYFPILCKTFSFTTSITISFICDGYRVEWFPINVVERTHGKSRVKLVRDGFITLYYIFRNGIALRTRGLRAWARSLR